MIGPTQVEQRPRESRGPSFDSLHQQLKSVRRLCRGTQASGAPKPYDQFRPLPYLGVICPVSSV